MKAGIDFGSTLTKVAYLGLDGKYRLFSTSEDLWWSEDRWRSEADDESSPQQQLRLNLKIGHVTGARATGIGKRWIYGIPLAEPQGDRIADEIALQADGVKRLLAAQKTFLGERFLLVSVGTGTSYTLVSAVEAKRFPLGNPSGAGTVAGQLSLIYPDGSTDIKNLGELASAGRTCDLLVKDVLESDKETPRGEFVVSHFAKAGGVPGSDQRHDTSPEAVCGSFVSTLATSVVRDAWMIAQIPEYGPFQEIVVIGTVISRTAPLREQIIRAAPMLGLRANCPENGEYAAAIGALHAA